MSDTLDFLILEKNSYQLVRLGGARFGKIAVLLDNFTHDGIFRKPTGQKWIEWKVTARTSHEHRFINLRFISRWGIGAGCAALLQSYDVASSLWPPPLRDNPYRKPPLALLGPTRPASARPTPVGRTNQAKKEGKNDCSMLLISQRVTVGRDPWTSDPGWSHYVQRATCRDLKPDLAVSSSCLLCFKQK